MMITSEPDNNPPEDTNDESLEPPSKSQLKREADEITQLGKLLGELNAPDLAKIPLDEAIADAVHELRRIRSFVARKRQLHYLGKLLRKSDVTPIRTALQAIQLESQAQNKHFHTAEHWRDQLLEDSQALQTFIGAYPAVDRQRLRQLIRNHQRETEQVAAGKTPSKKAAREIFKLVRDAISE